MKWENPHSLSTASYKCGHCGMVVASVLGYTCRGSDLRRIRICPNCDEPTYFGDGKVMPDELPGDEVQHLPVDVGDLYKEARSCVSTSNYTASVLIARKLLMNIAVAQGANENLSFVQYVEYLADKGFVPPNGKGWVDHIRKKGNEANHEIHLMSPDDAKELIAFLEMLLKFIYEFPNKVPATT